MRYPRCINQLIASAQYLNVSVTSSVTMTTRRRVVPELRSEWPRTRAPIAYESLVASVTYAWSITKHTYTHTHITVRVRQARPCLTPHLACLLAHCAALRFLPVFCSGSICWSLVGLQAYSAHCSITQCRPIRYVVYGILGFNVPLDTV